MTEPAEIRDRLALVRARMARSGVQALLVRSTDRYLNEYVPNDESARVWISGFTGSMGEVVVTENKAYLFVDGRYWIQADAETDASLYEVVKVPLSTPLDTSIAQLLTKLGTERGSKKLTVGFDPSKMTPSTLDHFKRSSGDKTVMKPLFPSPVEVARGPQQRNKPVRIRAINEKSVGATVDQKLKNLRPAFEKLGIDALIVQRLDEIAYLSNLRGDELPYQATFKSIALVTTDRLFVGIDPARVPKEVRLARPSVLFVPEQELATLIGKKTKRPRVGFDPKNNTEQARLLLVETGATIVEVDTPLAAMKARKNRAELELMIRAFARADAVVEKASRWLINSVIKGQRVSEADFAEKVHALFGESGAVGLSFKVISAAGRNGAIIHYSDPNKKRLIKRGELMLLDTGAYYDEGYATDLTRTFLVDSAKARGTEKQRRYYTLVLKSAIAGMTATLPEGARGYQLDAITRAPLWAAGLDFNHGTGHGVGVNVHEFPPRIGPGADAKLEEGFVFSIEPGIYIPSFGGVRIENLCTLRKVKRQPGYLEVEPLTFSPLDKRLIEAKLLSPHEKAWLRSYGKVHGSRDRRKLRNASSSRR